MAKGYGLYYDEEKREVAVRGFDVGNGSSHNLSGYDFSHVNETNLYDGKNGFNPERWREEKVAKEINDDLAAGRWLIHKCKDCGDYFLISEDEQIWFEDRNMSYPRRCRLCRDKRKAPYYSNTHS